MMLLIAWMCVQIIKNANDDLNQMIAGLRTSALVNWRQG